MFSSLSRKAPNRVFFSIVLGGLSGAIYSMLIPLLTNALQQSDGRFTTLASAPVRVFGLEVANAPLAGIFAGACLLIVACRTLSQIMLSRVAMNVASDMRVRMYDRIANAPVATLERIGSARLITTISADVPRIVAGTQMLPELLINSITLLGMLGFLFYLNDDVFWFVLKCIVIGSLTFRLPLLLGERYFTRAAATGDALQHSINGLIRGIKELKINDDKRQGYFATELMANEIKGLKAQKTGHAILCSATNYGEMISFGVIGAITFIFVNYHSISTGQLIAVIMALLYITGPIGVILSLGPQMTIASVSLRRIDALLDELPDEAVAPAGQCVPWSSIRFQGVRYQHDTVADVPGFAVGPLDFEFRKDQITFIVGGNGSGKSTLCKLLTLHYRASGGTIQFGDTVVGTGTIASCRQDIASIYSDYYLFDRLYGTGIDPAEVDRYLRLLKLDKKVSFRDGRFSTLSLSDGQRRRMALLAAFVEDKQLYLFDEWAADQDPTFKDVFYLEILPSLKKRGKAVVAITHDDRYFYVADQVITMADGKVISVKSGEQHDQQEACR